MSTNSNTRFVLGKKFDMSFKLSEVVLRGNQNKPIEPVEVYLQDLIVNYEGTGRVDVKTEPKGRSTSTTQEARVDEGNKLGETVDGQALVISDKSRFNTRGPSDKLDITLQSDSHLPTRISTLTARGNSVVRRRPL